MVKEEEREGDGFGKEVEREGDGLEKKMRGKKIVGKGRANVSKWFGKGS